MSATTLATLRRMANDIARNLEAMGHDKAVLATADHIDKFWDPRMKRAIFADDERFGVLVPIAAEALVVGEDLRLHPRVPELVDVVRRRQHGLVVAHRFEVAGDVIGHAAQGFDGRAHSAGSISVPAMRRERSESSV